MTINRFALADQHAQGSMSSLSLPLCCAWLLLVFTIGNPQSPNLPLVLPEAMLTNAKLFLRLSMLAVLVMVLLKGWRQRGEKVVKCVLPFGLLSMWALASTIWSPLPKVTLGQSMCLLTLVVLGAVIAIKWNGEGATSAVLRCLTLGTVSCSILLLLLGAFLPESGVMTRGHGGLFHATNASATASLGMVMLVAARLLWGWTWSRQLWYPGILAHAAVLVISTNRVAFALAVVLSTFLYGAFFNRLLLNALVVLFSALAVVYLAMDPGLELATGGLQRFSDYAERDQSSAELATLSGRHEMWEAIWKSFAESPWIGHGYFVTSSTGRLHVWNEWHNWTAHNAFLQLLVTSGIIGVLYFGWGVMRLGCSVLSRPSGGHIDWKLKAFLVTVGVWYLGWGLLNESVFGPLMPESVVFFACVGIAAGAACSAAPDARGGFR